MTEVTLTEELTELLRVDTETMREEYQECMDWMMKKGKNPVKSEPLGSSTAENYIERLDKLQRFNIQYLDPDRGTVITDEQADEILRLLAEDVITKNSGDDFAESSKRKFADTAQKYLEWKYHEGPLQFEWQPRINFSQTNHNSAAKFSYQELGGVFKSAKEYGSLPSYYESSPEEREQIKGLVAQRLSRPKSEIKRKDWLRADQSTKIHALILTAYDAGLAPKEVRGAEVGWFQPERNVLKIPTEDATKQRSKEEVSLADETCEALSKWIRERRHLEKYDGTSKLWLNREANPYSSGSLCSLIRKLCDDAGIPTEDRAIRWYSLRHTSGRNVTNEGSLAEANDQLRHDSLETTQETYNESPLEKLRQTVEKTHEKANRAADDPDYNPYADAEDESQQAQNGTSKEDASSDDVVEHVGGGNVHVDAVIEDTTQERVDISHEILPDSNS